MKRRSLFRFLPGRFAVLVAPLIAAWPMQSMAAPAIWTGGDANANWSSALNWGGIAPATGDYLIMAGTANLLTNNDLAAATVFPEITFAPGAGNFTLGGNAITLTDAGPSPSRIRNDSLNSTQTIASALTLDGTAGTFVSEINALSGSLVFNGTVTALGNTQLLAGAAAGRLALFNAPVTTTGGVTFSGPGTVALNAVNSFAAGQSIGVASGRLRVLNAGALGTAAAALNAGVDVASGAQVNFNGTALTGGGKNFSIAGAGPDGSGALVNHYVNVDANKAVSSLTLTGNATIGGTKTIDIGNGTAGQTLDGGGYTLTVNTRNRFNLRTPNIVNLPNIVLNSGNIETEGADVPADTAVTINGSRATLGAWLGGTGTTRRWSGDMTLNNGANIGGIGTGGAANTLVIGSAGKTLTINGEGRLNANTAAFIDWVDISGAGNMRVESTVSGNGRLVVGYYGVGTNGTTVQLADNNPGFGGITQITGGTLQLGTGGGTGDLGASPLVQFTNGGGTPLLSINRSGDLALSNAFTGPGNIQIDNVGANVTLSGPNNTGGAGASAFATRVRGGTLTLGAANALSPRATFEIGGLGVGTGSLTVLNGFSPTVERFDDAGTDTPGVFNRVINGSTTPATLTFNINNAGPVFGDFGGVLGGATPEENNFGLTKLGANDWGLAGNGHTYTGLTTIRGGTIRISNDTTGGAYGIGQLGSSTGTTDATVITPGGSLDFGGFSAGDERLIISGRGNTFTAHGFESGALRNNPGTAAASVNSAKFVTLAGDASIGKAGSGADANNWEIRNTGGTAQLNLSGYTLRKTGNNTVVVADVTGGTGAGNIEIRQGTLSVERGTVLSAGGTVTVASRSNLALADNGAAVTVAKAVALNSGSLLNLNGSHSLTAVSTNGYFTAENNSAADTLGLGSIATPTRGAGAYLGTTGTVTLDGFSAGQRLGPGWIAGASAGAAAPALWDGSKVAPVALTANTGVPLTTLTGADVLANSATDADRTINSDLTIRSLTSQADVKINDGALLRVSDGSITQRGANHWIQTTAGAMGRITSGRSDGEFHLNLPEPLDTASRNDITLRVRVTDNPTAGGTFVPNLLVKNGTGSATNFGGSGFAAPTNNTFNSYTAGTIINAGRVVPQFGSAFGTGPITIRDGGQLATYSLTAANGAHVSNALSLAGNGVLENAGALGAIRLANAVTFSGNTTLAADTRLHPHGGGDVGTLAGVVSGTAGIDKTGDGFAALVAANNYTGATTITRGTLVANRLSHGGLASSIGASSSAAANLVFNGGTLRYDGPGASSDRSFTVDLGGGAINSNYHTGGLTISPASIAMTEGGDRGFSLLATNRTANTFNGVLSDPGSGRTSLTFGGIGTWQITQNQLFSGTVTVTNSATNFQGGTLLVGNGGNSGDIGRGLQLTLANASDIAFNRSDNLEISHAISGAANSEIIQLGSGTLTLSGTADNATGNLRVENGTVVLAKISSFNVHAAAVNLFLNNGRVQLAGTGDDQIFNGTAMFVRGGTFDMNGRSEVVARIEGNGGTILNSAPGTVSDLRIGNGNANSAFTGTFIPGVIGATGTGGYGGTITDGAGTVRLSKDGTGLVAVTGTNSYSGGTEILQGTLQVGKGGTTGSLGSGPVFLGGGDFGTNGSNVGTLRVDRAGSLQMNQTISGPGNVEKRGSGELILTARNSWEGVTVVRNGTLTANLASNDNVLPSHAGYALEGGTLKIVGRSGGDSVQTFAPANAAITNVSGTGAGAGTASFAIQGSNLVGDNNGGNLTVALPNSLSRSTGGSADFATTGSGTTRFTTGAANSNGILASSTAAYATWNGSTWAVQDGGRLGGLAASGYGTAAGHLDVPSGTIPIAPGTTAATARFNSAGISTVDLSGGTSTLSQGGILITPAVGAATVAIQNGSIATGGNELIVHQHNTAGNAVFAATLGGTQSLVKAGAGKLILTGANTATGATFINQGTLQVGDGSSNTGTLPTGAITNDGNLAFARVDAPLASAPILAAGNVISGSGSVSVSAGSGWIDFNRVAHNYTGATTISSGYVQSLVNTSGQVAPVTLGDASTGSQPVALVSNHIAVTNYNYPIIVPANGGTGPVIIGSSGGSGAVAAIFNGTLDLNRPVTLTGQHPDRTSFTNSIRGNVGTIAIDVLDSLGNPLLPGVTPPASTVGARRITWEGENSFVGNVEIRNGSTLQIGAGTAGVFRDQIPDASNVTLTGANSTLQFNYEGEVINELYGEAGTLVRSIATGGTHMVLSVNGGNYQGAFDGGANGGMVLEKNSPGVLILGGPADNGSGRLRVNDGLVILDKTTVGSKAVAIDLTINGGSVVLGGTSNDQIWDGTVVTANVGSLDLNGRNETISVLQGLAGTVTNSAAGTASILEIGNTSNASSSVFFGSITDGAGSVGIVKNATVAHGLVLAGNNNYSGGTTVNAGSLQIGNGGTRGSAGSGSITMAANTRIILDRTDDFSLSNALTGGGSLTHQGKGTVSLTGTNSLTGPVTINDGATLAIGNGGSTGEIGSGSISNFGELRFNRLDRITLANSIADLPADRGTVRQAGAGTTVLTGVSQYYGNTIVDAGTLQVDGALQTTATTVNGPGTLAGSGSVADVTVNGGRVAPGSTTTRGRLTTGSLTTTGAGGVFAFDISGALAGSQYDQIASLGTVDLGSASLAVTLADGYTPGVNDSFLLWLNDGSDAFLGTFAGLSEGASFAAADTLDPNDFWTVTYSAATLPGSDGNDFALTYIPEPSSAFTAAAGLAALGLRRRREKTAA